MSYTTPSPSSHSLTSPSTAFIASQALHESLAPTAPKLSSDRLKTILELFYYLWIIDEKITTKSKEFLGQVEAEKESGRGDGVWLNNVDTVKLRKLAMRGDPKGVTSTNGKGKGKGKARVSVGGDEVDRRRIFFTLSLMLRQSHLNTLLTETLHTLSLQDHHNHSQESPGSESELENHLHVDTPSAALPLLLPHIHLFFPPVPNSQNQNQESSNSLSEGDEEDDDDRNQPQINIKIEPDHEAGADMEMEMDYEWSSRPNFVKDTLEGEELDAVRKIGEILEKVCLNWDEGDRSFNPDTHLPDVPPLSVVKEKVLGFIDKTIDDKRLLDELVIKGWNDDEDEDMFEGEGSAVRGGQEERDITISPPPAPVVKSKKDNKEKVKARQSLPNNLPSTSTSRLPIASRYHANGNRNGRDYLEPPIPSLRGTSATPSTVTTAATIKKARYSTGNLPPLSSSSSRLPVVAQGGTARREKQISKTTKQSAFDSAFDDGVAVKSPGKHGTGSRGQSVVSSRRSSFPNQSHHHHAYPQPSHHALTPKVFNPPVGSMFVMTEQGLMLVSSPGGPGAGGSRADEEIDDDSMEGNSDLRRYDDDDDEDDVFHEDEDVQVEVQSKKRSSSQSKHSRRISLVEDMPSALNILSPSTSGSRQPKPQQALQPPSSSATIKPRSSTSNSSRVIPRERTTSGPSNILPSGSRKSVSGGVSVSGSEHSQVVTSGIGPHRTQKTISKPRRHTEGPSSQLQRHHQSQSIELSRNRQKMALELESRRGLAGDPVGRMLDQLGPSRAGSSEDDGSESTVRAGQGVKNKGKGKEEVPLASFTSKPKSRQSLPRGVTGAGLGVGIGSGSSSTFRAPHQTHQPKKSSISTATNRSAVSPAPHVTFTNATNGSGSILGGGGSRPIGSRQSINSGFTFPKSQVAPPQTSKDLLLPGTATPGPTKKRNFSDSNVIKPPVAKKPRTSGVSGSQVGRGSY